MLRLDESAKAFSSTYKQTLPHALLLVGKQGSGLYTFAHFLTQTSGVLLSTVRPEQKSSTSIPVITVERIRDLYAQTRSRFDRPHFVIIDDADKMNHVAQNALLKLLEEPNESIHFILTSHSPDVLLPTIRSRVQRFDMPIISELESMKLLKTQGITDEADIRRLLYIASGLPAELTRLSGNPKEFKLLAEQVVLARQFIEGTTYQKMVLIQQLKDDRAGAIKLIELILLLLRRTLATSSSPSALRLIEKLIQASEAIRANGNIRLQLMLAVV